MKKIFWIYCSLLASFLVACSDDVEDVSGFYFKAVENQEDKLPADIQFRTAGGSFEIMFDTGQDWVAEIQGEDEGWLHLSQTEGGVGVNTLVLTIDSNSSTESRSAAVLILARTMGKRIKIVQNGLKQEREKADRSVLAYLAAENSLSSFAMEDLDEIIEGAKSIGDSNHLLVFVDDCKLPRIYEVAPNEVGITDTIRVMDYPVEYDSADPATLTMALNYMKENYEAEEYGLVMWSHGEGWIPGTTRYIGIDNNHNSNSNSGSLMGIDQLKEAIAQSVEHLEFLFFDACFMMTAEVAYELRNSCHYMIGSPCEIPGPGAPYQTTVPAMFDTDLGQAKIAETYYQYYQNRYGSSTSSSRYGALLATMDCTKMDAFADVTAEMTQRYFTDAKLDSSAWIQYGYSSVVGGYSRTDMYLDMMQVMRDTLDESDYAIWEAAFKEVILAFHATNFWFSSAKGMCLLDLSVAGGLAITIPQLITNANELADLQKMEWYDKVWK